MVHQSRILSVRFASVLPALLLAATLTAPVPGASAATVELAGPAGAEVFLNGDAVGFLPLAAPLDLPTGRHVLRCELYGHQTFEVTLHLVTDDDHKRIRARLMPLRRRTALAADLLLAGLGQHYSGQKMRGWLYSAVEAGGLLTALTGELRRSDYRKDYLLLLAEYGRQINADRIAEYKQLTLVAYADMEDAEQVRNTGLLIAGGAVVMSLLDTAFFFPSIQAGPGLPVTRSESAEAMIAPDWRTVHLGYRVDF